MLLEKIVNNRRILIEKEKTLLPLTSLRKKAEELQESGYVPADFINKKKFKKPFLIAEIKKSSPSKGIIREDFNLDNITAAYKSSGHVNAISVLTEPDYFSGSYDYLRSTKEKTGKPVLMKDFIFDEYQIYRGFIEGASAVLLIAAVLDDNDSRKLSKLASGLNLSILFETHTSSEYRRAIQNDFSLIGINNRDLKTFVTDINTTVRIIESEGKPEDKIIISESGINRREDIDVLLNNGADGFLIGERFMRQENINAAIEELFGYENPAY